MATQTAFTLDQFLELPEREDDGTQYELSEGELIVLPSPGYRHGIILMNAGRILGVALDRKRYLITGADSGFILKADPLAATVRGPDVAVCLRESVEPLPPTAYLTQAPMLAVEVVSPSNTASDLERKVNQYLSAGGQEVWLLYPETRRLYVYSRGAREAKIFEAHERFASVVGQTFEVAPFFEM
jgi:Uma2 family endonuclease